jgi:hypothetical protein
MLHTLFDCKDENHHNAIKDKFQLGGPSDNYFGKGNKAIDQYNRKKVKMENDANFEKTKHKVKLVVYKNGFILNNGQFRDRSINENCEFLEEVEKGQIPQELIRKGIKDLGILLINRKTEMFRSPLYNSLPISFNILNFSNKSNQPENKKQDFNTYLDDEKSFQNNGISDFYSKKDKPYIPQTPFETRNFRNNIFYEVNHFQVYNIYNKTQNSNRTNSLSKDKKFMTLNDINIEKNERKKPFKPFSGTGQLLGAANIFGIQVGDVDETKKNLNSNYIMNFNHEYSPKTDYGMKFNEFKIDNNLRTQLVY